MPSNQSPKMVRASVSAQFCLLWQICLNCGCLSPVVPGALISRLLILNTHFTSKATSNPQQVSGALKIMEAREISLCERRILRPATSWAQSSPGMAATKVLKGSFTGSAAPPGMPPRKKAFDGEKKRKKTHPEQGDSNSPAK